MFELNRVKYIRPLTKNTPRCVLKELLILCNLHKYTKYLDTNYISVIRKLETYKGYTLPDTSEYTHEDLRSIAEYVSTTDESWTSGGLSEAFKHLKSCEIPKEEFRIGPKTNKFPYSYDACMLFKLCQTNSISLTFDTTIEQMREYISFINLPRNELISKIINKLYSVPRTLLVILTGIRADLDTDFVFDETRINEINGEMLKDEKYVIKNSDHIDDDHAIVYCMKYFNIDISETEYPRAEFNHIKTFPKALGKYTPLDQKFQELYTKNPSFYDVRYNFKSRLREVYTHQDLMNLVKYEGLSILDIQSREDACQRLFNCQTKKTFYQGVIPYTQKTETFVYQDPIAETNKELLVSYGILTTNKFIILTIQEIIDHFKHYDFPVDFETHAEVISDEALDKLELICDRNPWMDEYADLRQIISGMRLAIKIKKESEVDFVNFYKTNEFQQQYFDKFISEMLELAMYMRGWNGIDEFPLKSEVCNKFALDDIRIAENVTKKYASILELVKNMSEDLKDVIYKLPLVKFNDKEKSFYISIQKDEGLTLMERIKIVVDKHEENIYSCIRMSSNHIASSAYYYRLLTKKEKLFQISEMDCIS